MTLALAILFLWVGAALLYVAFHPPAENKLAHPGDAIQEIVSAMGTDANTHSKS